MGIGSSIGGLVAAGVLGLIMTTTPPAAASVTEVSTWDHSLNRSSSTDDGGKIVSDQDFGHAFTMNADGSQFHSVGVPGSTVCTFWSPNGRKLACNVFTDNGPKPATANPDGSDFALLTRSRPFDLFCIYWSPTGARLLCHSEGIPNVADAGLYTVRSSDGGDPVRISATPRGFYDLVYGYSRDGTRVLYGRFDFATNTGRLFTVKTDGSHLIKLSPNRLRIVDLTFYDQVSADWSPGGGQVAFAAVDPSERDFTTALFVVNSDGSGLHRITPWDLGATSAQWAPNGRLIAFGSCCAQNEVWVVRPDGSHLKGVTHSATGIKSVAPIWSPDGRRLLFGRENSQGRVSLWTAAVNGSRLRKLIDVAGLTHYAWGARNDTEERIRARNDTEERIP